MNIITTITAPADVAPAKTPRLRVPAIFTAAFWIGEYPNPEYSRLDRLDGLGAR